jgi:hypothetical protein
MVFIRKLYFERSNPTMENKTKNSAITSNTSSESNFENLDVYEKQETGYPSIEMVVDGTVQSPNNLEKNKTSMQ